jgi:hypothetical protein
MQQVPYYLNEANKTPDLAPKTAGTYLPISLSADGT